MNICNREINNWCKLPPEDLMHVASYLELKEVKQLHATCHVMQPITQRIISIEILKKLEDIILKNSELLFLFQVYNLPVMPEEKLSLLQKDICSYLVEKKDDIIRYTPIWHEIKTWDLQYYQILNVQKWKDIKSFCRADYRLANKILKVVFVNLNLSFTYPFSGKIIQKCFSLAMDMLVNNNISNKHLIFRVITCEEFGYFKDINLAYLNGKILTITLRALENQSLNEVYFKVRSWNYEDVNDVLEDIKKYNKINSIKISEGYLEHGWDHNAKLNRIINQIESPNKVKFNSYIQSIRWSDKYKI